MAMDLSALTFNAKEEPDFAKFISERMFEQAALETMHGPIMSGLTMKQQIVFASAFGLSGIADTGCTRPESGAKSTLTQKFWEPKAIGDTFPICQADYNQLFKAYYDKITSYKERFDITGSDEELFLAAKVSEAASMMIRRLVWFGDTAVAAANATDAGLKAAGNVKFFSPLDGLWKQIFAEVTANALQRVTIDENSQVTTALQLNLAAGRSIELFESMWAKADDRLKADPTAKFMVSGAIFENYRQWLQSQSLPFNPTLTMDGMPSLMWNGHEVVNMSSIWGVNLSYFTNNTTDNAYWLPNRILFTAPSNIPVGTLNDGDFNELESWYERKERKNYTAYGMTLDAKFLEGYMGVAAY